MRDLTTIINLVLALTATALASANQPQEITPGAAFRSPDGNFVAKTLGGGMIAATDRIAIVENKSGREAATIDINPPLYSLRWTQDSKAIVTISHIAGGTVAGVIHLVDGQWKQVSADPREGDKYRLIHQVVKGRVVELTYKVARIRSNNTAGTFYTYTFLFDPTTTAHTGEKRRQIDAETYGRLRLD
jgi:hypothetical protein